MQASDDEFTGSEIAEMASYLERAFGPAAQTVAELFAREHATVMDDTRADAWRAVSGRLSAAADLGAADPLAGAVPTES